MIFTKRFALRRVYVRAEVVNSLVVFPDLFLVFYKLLALEIARQRYVEPKMQGSKRHENYQK